MTVYEFYSDHDDRHNRYNELRKKGIDPFSRKIPPEFRSSVRDYIVVDVECPRFYNFDRIQIWWDSEKNKWCYGTIGRREDKFDLKSWVSYPDSIKESNIPDTVDNEFKELLVILALLKGGEGRHRDEDLEDRRMKIAKKLGFN